ncbi:MAG: tRNA pseudouridine(55) synthase TruB [Paraprevotella sp.]|nr:tRNA pseudouridine(55) synthase TruB [Bacteroidaceae bacterium]MCI7081503.1 tRNA pseudouridine(55) synthase TruB [Paraprevotella sp.]MCI7141704.1 tRNA pseudouridine(55) synthase TruB [Paraprevotella sp.]MCI7748272.1 tRNA pseudouridine(55) synthase TruB [Paraprevotella sp.]MDD5971146.1 tRNA pseudouridine(55) synthase TruB [Paraprevotella sp.]
MNISKGEILHIDKPLGWTSFNVVARVRWLICRKAGIKKLKVGHAGTLDPLATGVMTVCVGKATRLIPQLQAHTKEYVATLQLGATTPSFDLEKPVDATYPTSHITREGVLEVLQTFIGEIEQVPPSFSACKVNGHRAYDLARKGQEVTLQPKLLVIDRLELIHFDAEKMQMTIGVTCSKGTYIRALARDIGQALHSGAHLLSLRRTRVGEVSVEDCMDMEHFAEWLDTQEIIQEPTQS